MSYVANAKRYEGAEFRRCGRSGIVLPPVSLGLWQNFGGADVFETGRASGSPGIRSRGDALRSGEQLRAAVWVGGGELRGDSAQRLSPITATSF